MAEKNAGKDTPVLTLPDKKNGKKNGKTDGLPKGQSRHKDGTLILKAGGHDSLAKAEYEVHGARLQLSGKIFVAALDVDWLPTKNCVCKVARPQAMEIRRLASGHFAVMAECTNKKCSYNGATYLWIHSKGKFKL